MPEDRDNSPLRTNKEKFLERVYFNSGQTVFKEGMRGRRAYLIEAGTVIIWTAKQNKQVELERLGAHCLFGELALILDDAPRSANATVLGDTTLVVIKDYEFKNKLTSSDPFVRGLVRILAYNLRTTTRHVFSMAEAR
ncbi:MAG: cyclic nucleotide-binding domain-containing protein [Alphaproteobacteria bacterium]|nr:cyclic nucleotide-binding domain-containing protein [Alphaproteobacteria bacterium]